MSYLNNYPFGSKDDSSLNRQLPAFGTGITSFSILTINY